MEEEEDRGGGEREEELIRNLKRARLVELAVRPGRFSNFVFDRIKYIKEEEEVY